jgi:hypothetical protein
LLDRMLYGGSELTLLLMSSVDECDATVTEGGSA